MGVQAADRINSGHVRRLALLYVRQSTLRQVMENTESTTRQYGLRQRAIALGWPAERIVVIDCDQGQSGKVATDREGFQHLVAEVSMGRAGIVLGLEVSRLARNNADWQRLLEICALTDTLILDEDGLYDPNSFNDRLLLGIKGTLSEAELHVLQARMQGGVLSKARRGELASPLPVGLVYNPAGRVELDPDAGVQQAVRHLFATFERTGSAYGTVAAFATEKLLFPTRVRTGDRKGELMWAPLRHTRVVNTLHNPRYAGAFVFGRRRTRRRPDGGYKTVWLPREEWTALIRDAHPGYISWDSFEANQARLAECARAHGGERRAGPAREGPALLQGLVVCGRCGQRMTVRYHTRRGVTQPDYLCATEGIQAATTKCQTVPGAVVDHAVAALLVDTLTPLTVEVALAVQAELDNRADEADRLRHSYVERARHTAELARRRYLAVDPDNRLVADALEADWNDGLRQLAAAQDNYDRQRAADTPAITEQQRRKILALAADFPALWADPATPQRERKRMARLLLEDVTLLKDKTIAINVRFRGGQTAGLTVPIPPTAWQARLTPAEIITEIDRLLDHHTDAQIADIFNQRGVRSGEDKAFNRLMIRNLRECYRLRSRYDRLRDAGLLTLTETAERLGVCTATVQAHHHAGLLVGKPFNDRGECLYEPPDTPPSKPTGRPSNPAQTTTP
jgi:DNA invertase Pin-like site-specific DNA recombinase